MGGIGGYFHVEYSNIELGTLHSGAYKLNTGRNCLEVIIRQNNLTHLYIPRYICSVVIETIVKCGISYSYYSIDEQLEIIDIPQTKIGEALLYVNYFGIKDSYLHTLSLTGSKLIIDNSQALFSAPLPSANTFYSLRKFAGVPDGSFLYLSSAIKTVDIPDLKLSPAATHLYKRLNDGPGAGYKDFADNDEELGNIPVGVMSKATQSFLKTYDFEKNKAIRERNFLLLHNSFSAFNQLSDAIIPDSINGPLCYPFLYAGSNVKKEMIKAEIFVPTYWPGIDAADNSFEKYLQNHLLPLPIDHRYGTGDMKEIISVFHSILGSADAGEI